MFDWKNNRATAPHALDFVFDTNAVRALGRLSEVDWMNLRNRVARAGLRSGWVPWVLAELLITNLNPPIGPTAAEFEEIRLAADRHDQLVGCNILLSPEPRVVRDVHLLAGRSPPVEPGAEEQRILRKGLDCFLSLTSPDQIQFKVLKGQTTAVYRPPGGKAYSFAIPQSFKAYNEHNIANTIDAPVGKKEAEVLSAARRRMERWIRANAKRLRLDRELIEDAVTGYGVVEFMKLVGFFGAAEGVYIEQHKAGRRSRIDENDGADIHFASYATESSILVTDDRRLRVLLRPLLEEWVLMKFEEFSENVP